MSRNPEASRAKLLDAARAEFAEHGLAGARVDRIARTAGVNKERLYAYFGNKERLYDTVIADALWRIREATPLTLAGGEGVGDFVRRVFEYHRSDDTLMRVFMWEALTSGGQNLVADDERRTFYAERVVEFADKLGIDDRRVAARLFFVLVGLAAWRAVMPNLAHLMTDGDADDDAGIDALRDFTVAFTERACAADWTIDPEERE